MAKVSNLYRLTQGDWSMAVSPNVGGSIASLKWRGHDILRSAPQDATSPLQMGSFPLIPYPNRIDRGAFRFGGREVVLPPTPGAEPHALHGIGWLRPWRVSQSGIDIIDLALAHDATPDWPWRWTASHGLRLQPDGLEMTLSITNEDREPAPAGLGLHPYFAVDAETVLTSQMSQVWMNGPDNIPAHRASPSSLVDWREGVTVGSTPLVDNAYCGWSGSARLDYGRYAVSLTASANARWLQVYAPRDESYICIEPMTQRPDAVNAPHDEDAGLITLMSGQSLSMSMRITVEPKSPLF